MFALQQASMEAPIPSADDLPEKPFLMDFADAVKSLDEKKPVRDIKMAAKKPVPYEISERSTYVPPAPKPVQTKQEKKIDLSLVKVGCPLRHKAFGMGTVKEIQGGLIVVVFGTAEKKFQFPGAFMQGFLEIQL